MIWYILQSGIIWGLLYLVYWVFLRHQTFFSYNRLYLILALLTGLIAPLVYHYMPGYLYPKEIVQELPTIYVDWMNTPMISANYSGPELQNSWWQQLPYQSIYISIGALLGIRLLIGIQGILRLRKSATRQDLKHYALFLSRKVSTPFSFFSWIFWNPQIDPQGEEGRHILAHEQAHARLFHSVDILLLEVLQILFWFNPILLLYKRAIRNVHEYQADAVVLQRVPVRPYGQLLLYQARYNNTQFLLVNHFLNSQIKKRIMMMTKTPSSRRRLWTYVLAIPVLLLCGLLFIQANMAENIPEHNTSLEKVNSITDPDEMPVFAGCADITDADQRTACSREHLFKYIIKEMKYPKAAKEAGVEGKALIAFTIDKEGNVQDVKIEHDPGEGCGAEAMRIVSGMPKWIPGKKDGKAVAVEMKLPFLFKLDDKEEKKHATDGPDQMPVFTGCDANLTGKELTTCSNGKLIEFVGKNMRYPETAVEGEVEGMVVVSFDVEADGSVTNAKVLKSLGGGCDEEVIRVIYSMPTWQAGTKDGKAVKTEMRLPVKFVLDSAKDMNKQPLKYDLQLNDYMIAPNPSTGIIDLKFKGDEAATSIRIFNQNGQMVYSQEESNFNGFFQRTIDLQQHGAGTYFLQIRQGGKAFTDQIIVQ